MWGNDFAEVTGGEFEKSGWSRFLGDSGTVSGRELLAKLAAEVIDFQDTQYVFNRTLCQRNEQVRIAE